MTLVALWQNSVRVWLLLAQCVHIFVDSSNDSETMVIGSVAQMYLHKVNELNTPTVETFKLEQGYRSYMLGQGFVLEVAVNYIHFARSKQMPTEITHWKKSHKLHAYLCAEGSCETGAIPCDSEVAYISVSWGYYHFTTSDMTWLQVSAVDKLEFELIGNIRGLW